MITTMVEEEVAAGRLVVDLEPEILAEAIVRVADAFMTATCWAETLLPPARRSG